MLDILRLGNMTSSSFVLQECIFYCFVLFYLASLSLSRQVMHVQVFFGKEGIYGINDGLSYSHIYSFHHSVKCS